MLDQTTLIDSVLQWAVQEIKQLHINGRLRWLSDIEENIAEEAGVKYPFLIQVFEVDEMPSAPPDLKDLADEFLDPANAAGLTLGYTILIRKGCYSNRLMRHELRHVAQVDRVGGLRNFMSEYLSQVMTVGYQDAPFEIEARKFENREN